MSSGLVWWSDEGTVAERLNMFHQSMGPGKDFARPAAWWENFGAFSQVAEEDQKIRKLESDREWRLRQRIAEERLRRATRILK